MGSDSVQTYRWFVGYYGSKSPSNYINTALGIKGSGTITIDNSYAMAGTSKVTAEKVALQTLYAGNDFTVDVNLELMCVVNTSTTDGITTTTNVTNTFDLNSNYNTTFAIGKTISVTNNKTPAVTAAASAITPLTIQTQVVSSGVAAGKVYMGSKIVSSSVVHVRAMGSWGSATTEQSAAVQFCGNVNNEFSQLGIWRKSKVELNMSNNALAIAEGGTITMGYSNTLDILGANQLSRATLSLNRDGGDAHNINLNGNSMGFYADSTALQIQTLKLNSDKTNDMLVNIDFGANETAQVLAFGSLVLAETTNETGIVFKNYVVGSDRFIVDSLLDSTWIGSTKEDGIITFAGYTHADGYYITSKEITDASDLYYGMYEYTVAVIPEASTVAAVFGALALGFVAYRRRK